MYHKVGLKIEDLVCIFSCPIDIFFSSFSKLFTFHFKLLLGHQTSMQSMNIVCSHISSVNDINEYDKGDNNQNKVLKNCHAKKEILTKIKKKKILTECYHLFSY